MGASEIIISILKRILGEPKNHRDAQEQFEFNCNSSQCKGDHNKFNLTYSTKKNVFRCWKCDYRGYILKFFETYGTEDDCERAKLVLPKRSFYQRGNKSKSHIDENSILCELPEGYIPLSKRGTSINYHKAMEYLRSRRIDKEIINKHKIGYTEGFGDRRNRIIIPSYNTEGKINYYEARSYLPNIKPPYLKPDYPDKSDIIFNVSNIDFNLPVYLVEGVFDMFPLPNAIPLLGKDLSDLLFRKLKEYQTKVILCLDEDALRDSVKLYNKLTEYGLDVYFVFVKDDIAKYYEKHGKEGILKLVRAYRKIDLAYFAELKMRDKKISKHINERQLEKEWLYLKNQLRDS